MLNDVPFSNGIDLGRNVSFIEGCCNEPQHFILNKKTDEEESKGQISS